MRREAWWPTEVVMPSSHARLNRFRPPHLLALFSRLRRGCSARGRLGQRCTDILPYQGGCRYVVGLTSRPFAWHVTCVCVRALWMCLSHMTHGHAHVFAVAAGWAQDGAPVCSRRSIATAVMCEQYVRRSPVIVCVLQCTARIATNVHLSKNKHIIIIPYLCMRRFVL